MEVHLHLEVEPPWIPWCFCFGLTPLLVMNLKLSMKVFMKLNTPPSLHGLQFPTLDIIVGYCHDPNLGLVTKARACKGAHQEGSPRITFHAPKSVGECEGMNLHIPKWAFTLGVGVPMDSWIFREVFQGPNSLD
jgi:hypothetical protein